MRFSVITKLLLIALLSTIPAGLAWAEPAPVRTSDAASMYDRVAQETFLAGLTPDERPNAVRLKSRVIVPGYDSELAESSLRQHLYAQFSRNLNSDDRAALLELGVQVRNYVTNRTYIVDCPPGGASALFNLSITAGIARILPGDKVPARVGKQLFLDEAPAELQPDRYRVRLYDGLVLDDVADALAAIDITPHYVELANTEAFSAKLSEEQLQAVLAIDAVMAVDVVIAPTETLAALNALQCKNIPPQKSSKFKKDRSDKRNACGRNTHETREAFLRHGAQVLHNVSGVPSGWSDAGDIYFSVPGYEFGNYNAEANEWDALIESDNLIIVRSAGHARNNPNLSGIPHAHYPLLACGNTDAHPDNGPYNSIAGDALAKNVVTVGTVYGDDSMTAFSAFGPAEDGRIKPDVVGRIGFGVSDILGQGSKNEWGATTSTTATTQALAFFVQLYQKKNGDDAHAPSAAAAKACLIHGARDLTPADGQNGKDFYTVGPDYASGYGVVNLFASIKSIPNLVQGTITDAESHTYPVMIREGDSPLKATLAWIDPPGYTTATTALVSDLDLTVEAPDGSIAYPWVLDKAHPNTPATTGINSVDTTEQVLITAQQPGMYTVRVRGTSVPLGAQAYALVLSKASDSTHAPTSVSLTPDKASPQPAGTSVTWTAAATGDAATFEYQFSMRQPEAAGFAVQQAWSMSPTWTWDTTDAAEENTIRVEARIVGETATAESRATYTITPNGPTSVVLHVSPPSPQIDGSIITWTAEAEGGSGDFEYQFSLAGPQTNGIAIQQAWSASPTWMWNTTDAVGTSTVSVSARNTGETATADASQSYTIVTMSDAPTDVVLTANAPSGQKASTPVIWTAIAKGGGTYEYEFWLNAPSTSYSWRVARAYATDNTWTWDTTGETGFASVRVRVRALASTAAWEAFDTVEAYEITRANPAPMSVALQPALAGPQAAGTPVRWIATAEGSGAYEYEFLLSAPTTGYAWRVVRTYDAGNTWTWDTSEETGLAHVQVRVRAQDSTAPFEVFDTVSNYEILGPAAVTSGVALSSNVPSPQSVGTAITWTAAVQDNGMYEFQFLLDGPQTAGPSVQRAWSSDPTWQWQTAGAAGTSLVTVQARKMGAAAIDTRSLTYKIIGEAPSSVQLTPQLPSPQPAGTLVTWTAKAQGTGAYEYEFWLQAPSTQGEWRVVRSYSPDTTWVWDTTPDAGAGSVFVRVRSQGSRAAWDTFASVVGYGITRVPPPPTSVALTPSTAGPQVEGAQVVWTASVAGPGPYEYEFWLQAASTQDEWRVVRAYAPDNTWTWNTNQESGVANIHVRVRAHGSTAAYEAFTGVNGYRILPLWSLHPATSVTLSPNVPSPQSAGTIVTWTAKASGGGVYEYEFWLNAPSTGNVWRIIRPYDASNMWVWDTTDEAGQANVHVRVRSQGNPAAYETFATSPIYRVN